MSYGPGRRTTTSDRRAKQDLEAVEKRVAQHTANENRRLEAKKQKRAEELKNFVVGDTGTKNFNTVVKKYKDDGVMSFTPTLPG